MNICIVNFMDIESGIVLLNDFICIFQVYLTIFSYLFCPRSQYIG